jgi:hypothetical protein
MDPGRKTQDEIATHPSKTNGSNEILLGHAVSEVRELPSGSPERVHDRF